MKSENYHYVPILKWRQGEYQALMRLKDEIKEQTLPLIVIPPVEFDFEEQCSKKTAQEHIEPFTRRYAAKWGTRRALIDLHESLEAETMDNGCLAVDYIFESLRPINSDAVPVVRFAQDSNFINAIKKVVATDQKGIALRIKLQDLMMPTLNNSIQQLASDFQVSYPDIDLIIDLAVPQAFEPYTVFSKALVTALKKISELEFFRSFVVAGMSLNLTEVRRPGAELTRHEWFLYQQLVKKLSEIRKPSFGDYTIETPDFIQLDMRLLKPAGKIVYTTETTWLIAKGKKFRGNESQMVNHCSHIMNSGHYYGPDYSHGDQRIYDTLHSREGIGNLGTWKQVGVNHHITLVVNQLAKYHAS